MHVILLDFIYSYLKNNALNAHLIFAKIVRKIKIYAKNVSLTTFFYKINAYKIARLNFFNQFQAEIAYLVFFHASNVFQKAIYVLNVCQIIFFSNKLSNVCKYVLMDLNQMSKKASVCNYLYLNVLNIYLIYASGVPIINLRKIMFAFWNARMDFLN
jgi:hypothetical protein